MAEATVEVRNPSGLHARPLAAFVKGAAGFNSTIKVSNLDRDPELAQNAKSMLALLKLGVRQGNRIRISADGDDAETAVAVLVDLVASGLGEKVGPA